MNDAPGQRRSPRPKYPCRGTQPIPHASLGPPFDRDGHRSFGAGAASGPLINLFGSLYPCSPLRINCVTPSEVLMTLLFSSHDHMLMRRFGVVTRTKRLTTCQGSTNDSGS